MAPNLQALRQDFWPSARAWDSSPTSVPLTSTRNWPPPALLKDEIIGDGFDMVIMRELTGGLYFGDRWTKEVDGVMTGHGYPYIQ